MHLRSRTALICSFILAGLAAHGVAAERHPAELKITGDWQVAVSVRVDTMKDPITATVTVTPAPLVTVKAEKHDALPMFNPKAGGWVKGAALNGVKAQECTALNLLEPESFELRASADANAPVLAEGKDYAADRAWGTFGRIEGSSLAANQPVYASYRHGQTRLDSVVLTREHQIVLRTGEPRANVPQPPALQDGERRLANIYIPGRIAKLGPENLFPVLEPSYPEPPVASPTPVEKACPRTMAKLRQGEAVKILAWGDSVTDGAYLPDRNRERWQEQFVARLRMRFPKAKIELVTEAWGGRNTSSYLNEPTGSVHNYQEKVLAVKPDLIVSEFVNDAGLTVEQTQQRYGKLLTDFQGIGAEWIILTPHYVRPDWMGLKAERDCDDDPRPYVKGLREFATKNPVALADASLRYGHLWREGIPYNTLMMNTINHPNPHGMKLFADSLMHVFPGK